MDYEQILYEVTDRILTITLNRPDKMNAMTVQMGLELVDAFTRAGQDDSISVVVVTGVGRAFCAGADLSAGASAFVLDREDGPIDWSHESVRDGAGLITLAIYESTKPVIGAVNGAAVGVGATMLLPMDFRISSDAARFGFVFTQRGIVPEGASSWFLPRIVGLPKALDWCITGRVFDAAEAERTGLVGQSVAPEDLLPTAYALAAQIRDTTSPVAVALTRQALWRQSAADHPMEAHKIDSRGMYARATSADAAEGVTSFLEKRLAQFPDTVSRDMPSFYPWWPERLYN